MPTCEASFAYEYKNRRVFTSSSSPSRHTTRSLILYLPSHTFTMFPRGYFPQPPQSPYLAVPVLVPVFAAPVPVQAHATHTTNVYYNVQCDHHDCEQHRHNLGLANKAKLFLTGRSARPSAHEQHYLEAGPPRSPSRLSSRSGRPGSAVSSVVPSPSPSPSRSHFLHPPTPSDTQYPTATYRQPSPQPQPHTAMPYAPPYSPNMPVHWPPAGSDFGIDDRASLAPSDSISQASSRAGGYYHGSQYPTQFGR